MNWKIKFMYLGTRFHLKIMNDSPKNKKERIYNKRI